MFQFVVRTYKSGSKLCSPYSFDTYLLKNASILRQTKNAIVYLTLGSI